MNNHYPINYPLLEQCFPFKMEVYHIFDSLYIPCHWNDTLDFYLILSGTVEYLIHGQSGRLETGECIFINSGIIRSISSPDAIAASVFILHIPAYVLTDTSCKNHTSPAFIIFRRIKKVFSCLNEIYELFQDASSNQKRYMHLTAQLLSYIECNEKKGFIKFHQSKAEQLQSEIAKEALNYLHTHYQDNISICQLSKSIYVGQSVFYHCFKRFTKISPVQYLNLFRLRKAEVLLRTKKRSIALISNDCGFNSIHYFERLFKRQYGVTPLKYRKIALSQKQTAGSC